MIVLRDPFKEHLDDVIIVFENGSYSEIPDFFKLSEIKLEKHHDHNFKILCDKGCPEGLILSKDKAELMFHCLKMYAGVFAKHILFLDIDGLPTN